MKYREAGSGKPAIVFVHGWQSTGVTWKLIADRLSARHRTVVPDLRGMGDSASAPGPYTVEQFSEDVAELIRELALAPAVVVGHSMGGAVAMRLAIDHRDLLLAIVLVAAVPPTGLQFPPKVDAVFRGTAGNLENLERWLRRLSLEPLDDAQIDALKSAAATIRPEVALESYESWTRLDFADEARTITTPTLVLPGEFDRPNMTPELQHAAIVDLIPGARMEVIPRAAHYVPLEQAEHTADAIDRFIRTTRRWAR